MLKRNLLSILLLFTSYALAASGSLSNCECGTHATGITAYTVTGDDCCTGTPTTTGFFHEYEYQGGVWKRISTTHITGVSAQADCCPPDSTH